MKIAVRILIIVLVIAGVGYASYFFISTNQKDIETFETEKPFKATIEKKTVASGKVIPEIEINIKPQINGIVDELFVEEGEKVKTGDKIARIKVIPNETSLNNARGQVKNAEIVLNNAKIEFERSQDLYDKGVISIQEYNTNQLNYSQAKQSVQNAKNNLRIIKEGTVGGNTANTLIVATVSGTVLEIPVEVGDQVISSNNFNEGTTIASIADLSKMIFEGSIDEAEVTKLTIDMPLEIKLAAMDDQKFEAKLKFIAPKGTEENGTVQFKIKGDMQLEEGLYIRAGYSANASMVLGLHENVMSIKEALLQFDEETDEPYVEVEVGDQEFERRDLELGISDGIKVEIESGITMDDKIKVWKKNKAREKK